MHGTTFGGGPLVTAVASAVIDAIRKDDLLAHVRDVGSYFLEQLNLLAARHSSIREVRGRGLMIGLEMHTAELAESTAKLMLERRIILNRTSETVLRFLPPYILERVHVDQTVRALAEILADAPILATATASTPGANFHE